MALIIIIQVKTLRIHHLIPVTRGPSGNSDPSSVGIGSRGHDTRNNTEEERSLDEFINYSCSDYYKSEGEPEPKPEAYPDPDPEPEAEGEINAEPRPITKDDVKIA